MKTNSQLNVALHTLGHIAASQGEALTSEELAACAGTNPVVVRRVLGVLRRANIVASTRGRSGGWTLTKKPNEITLGQIHEALSPEQDNEQQQKTCTIADRLESRLQAALQRASLSMRNELDQTTLKDLI